MIGNLKVETDNMCHILDVDRYINKDLIDLVSDRYTIEEKRNFLSNSIGYWGYNVVKLVCCHLLPNLIASFPEAKEIRDNECLKLKRKIKKLGKGEEHDESGYDEDDDVDEEERGESEQGDDKDDVDEEGEEGDDDENKEGDEDEDEEGDEDEQGAIDEDEQGDDDEQSENDEEGEEDITEDD